MSKSQRDIDARNRQVALDGESAREVMQHPAHVAAVNAVEADILERWAESIPGKEGLDDREEAFRQYHALKYIKTELVLASENGRFAERALIETAEARERDMRLRETEEMGMH